MKKLRKISQKYYSRKSKGIISLTKLTICTAVILSLAFTANLSAAPTVTFTLDADALPPGSYPSPLVIATTSYGNITFVGEIQILTGPNVDAEFAAKGASGNVFDVLDPGNTPSLTAELFFNFDVNFDVISLEFIYGGNVGNIYIEARDKDGYVVDDFDQGNTFVGQPAGPETLSGTGIRSLYWKEDFITTGGSIMSNAPLDNIKVTVAVIPSPSAFVLAGIGVSFVGWLRKRRIV